MTENRRSTPPDLVGPMVTLAAAVVVVLWATFTKRYVVGWIALGCIPILFWVIHVRLRVKERGRP